MSTVNSCNEKSDSTVHSKTVILLSGSPLGLDMPLAVCDICVWHYPGRCRSQVSAHVCVCVYRLVANMTNLIPLCDDRTSHGRRSHGLVGSLSLACLGSSIREVNPREAVSPDSRCEGTSCRVDAVRVREFSGILDAHLCVNLTSFGDVEVLLENIWEIVKVVVDLWWPCWVRSLGRDHTWGCVVAFDSVRVTISDTRYAPRILLMLAGTTY